MKIHHSIPPKKATPNTSPRRTASRGRRSLLAAQSSGVGATNTRNPRFRGGNDAHRRAAERIAATAEYMPAGG
jgi:hypothetical protein